MIDLWKLKFVLAYDTDARKVGIDEEWKTKNRKQRNG